MMKDLYSHKQQKNKTFFIKDHALQARLHSLVTEMGNPLKTEHSHWLMFE